jgi:hypothetical protein
MNYQFLTYPVFNETLGNGEAILLNNSWRKNSFQVRFIKIFIMDPGQYTLTFFF